MKKPKTTKTNRSYPPQSASFNKKGIEALPKGRPVVYEIEGEKRKPEYVGVAKRGRVEERLKEHLPGGKDPVRGGKKVVVHPKSSIQYAKKSEARMIKDKQPRQNKRGK